MYEEVERTVDEDATAPGAPVPCPPGSSEPGVEAASITNNAPCHAPAPELNAVPEEE